ncbi:TonB-dependent receptor [Qipengyuania sp.]|uniref:TonB-dependent receptor n=1 Tax=Qipengyuania sp. TaxID=2004515 RepID=UPI003735ABC1
MQIKNRLLIGAAIVATAFPAIACAGDIVGSVSDANRTIALRAAEVRIVELGRAVATERDGSFVFADVPAGAYTLEISYVGAETQRETITVPETGTVRADIALSAFGDAEILVIGQAANLSSALSRKKEADGVSDVLTRDAIGQFPDQNVAESLRRLQGVNILNDQGEGRFVSVRGLDPELVSTSLNGVRLPAPESDVRSVALDVISSDIIESIEVKKSLTPDMDGDTIGASVEIETTSAFDRRTDLLTAKIEGSYNDYANELSPKGSVDFAYRVSDTLGISGGASYYRRSFETDNIEADDWVEAGDTIFPATVEYRDYDVERERISATLGLDVKAGEATTLYVKGLYSQFDDQEYRRRTTFDLGDFEDDGPSSFSGSGATFSDADQEFTVERDIKDRFESQKIRSITLGGESDWGAWFADYSASWAKSSEREDGSLDPIQFARDFDGDGLTIGFDYSDPRVPVVSVITDPGDFRDPATYELKDVESTDLSDAQDEEYALKLDLGRRIATSAGEFTVQAGVKSRWRDKTYDRTVSFYENDEFTLADAIGLGQTYRLTDISPVADYTAGTRFFRANFGSFELQELDSIFESAIADFAVSEDVLAGYLLGRWDSSTLRVIGGVRVERTRNDIAGNLVEYLDEIEDEDTGEIVREEQVVITPLAFERAYTDWLPSLNIRFEPRNDLVLRLAGYRSLVRPKLSKLAPRFLVEDDDEGVREGEFGNPDLQPYKAWNFDASAEWYMSRTGALTAAFFYKDISDYIVDTLREDGTYNGIAFDEAVIPINGENAQVYGFELGFARAFGGVLDGFILNANYTFTDASGTVFIDGDEGTPRDIPLPATSRHTANLSLGFDKGPIDVRLSGTYRDKYLDELADEAPMDRYVDDHFQLDLSAKYSLTDKVQLFYEWVNINNAKYFAYNTLGNRQNLYQYEEYGWTMKGGVRVTF